MRVIARSIQPFHTCNIKLRRTSFENSTYSENSTDVASFENSTYSENSTDVTSFENSTYSENSTEVTSFQNSTFSENTTDATPFENSTYVTQEEEVLNVTETSSYENTTEASYENVTETSFENATESSFENVTETTSFENATESSYENVTSSGDTTESFENVTISEESTPLPEECPSPPEFDCPMNCSDNSDCEDLAGGICCVYNDTCSICHAQSQGWSHAFDITRACFDTIVCVLNQRQQICIAVACKASSLLSVYFVF